MLIRVNASLVEIGETPKSVKGPINKGAPLLAKVTFAETISPLLVLMTMSPPSVQLKGQAGATIAETSNVVMVSAFAAPTPRARAHAAAASAAFNFDFMAVPLSTTWAGIRESVLLPAADVNEGALFFDLRLEKYR
jgi:hypothetical protein